MAKVVIAGRADCPYFARTELLGDRLERNLEDFKVHKIVKEPEDWEEWLKETCEKNGWKHEKSPLVWRELIDRGGKGVLIGGANEFQEYVQGYYDLLSSMTSDDMRKIAQENLNTKKEVDEEERALKALSNPVHVCITSASNPLNVFLVPRIVSGEVMGNYEIALHLLDTEDKLDSMKGLEIESNDLSEGLLRQIHVTTDPYEAFKDCSVIILLDNILKEEEESQEDWLKRNADFFINYAKIINDTAMKNCKIIVAGDGPLNFNAYMIIKHAPNMLRHNIVASPRMVENHAKAVIGEKLKVNTADVVNLILWGNINGTNFLDLTKTRVHQYDGAIWGPPSYSVSAVEMIHDAAWREKEFLELVQGRTEKIETALRHKALAAEACSVSSMLYHWMHGSPKDQIFSLGILSDGWYEIPEDMVFSFPVTLHPKGYWNVVQDIELDSDRKEKLKNIADELKKEIQVIFPPPFVELPESTVDIELKSSGGEVPVSNVDKDEEPQEISEVKTETEDKQEEKEEIAETKEPAAEPEEEPEI